MVDKRCMTTEIVDTHYMTTKDSRYTLYDDKG